MIFFKKTQDILSWTHSSVLAYGTICLHVNMLMNDLNEVLQESVEGEDISIISSSGSPVCSLVFICHPF